MGGHQVSFRGRAEEPVALQLSSEHELAGRSHPCPKRLSHHVIVAQPPDL
jgi:hypothetical protein